MKKLWSMLLVVAMLCGMYVVPVGAEDYNEYSEYIGAMGEAFEYGYENIYDGHSLKDAPYEWSNTQYGTDMLNSVWWDIKPSDEEVNRVKNLYNLEEFRCIYDKELLEQVINFKFNLSVDEIAEMANKGVSNSIIQKGNYWMALTYGRGDRWPECEFYVDEFEKLNESTAYAVWHYENPHDNFTEYSDTYYAILEKGIVAGKEIVGYRYLGTTPPSDELLAQYKQPNITVMLNGGEIQFDGEPTDLSNAYHTDFSKYPSLILDSFDQTDSPTPKERLSDLAWCMDAENGLTYKDLLKTDFKNTIIKMFDIFTVGQVTENQFEIASKYFPNEIGRPYKIFKKDEIDMLFNLYFNTSIDVLSLPDEYDETDYCYIDIFNDYFVFFGDYVVTDLQQAKWAGGCVINDCTYWKWVLCEGGSYSSPVISDTIHTVEKYTSMYGYDFYAVQYIGFEPPSSEMVMSYEYGTSGLISVKLNNKRIAFDQPPILVNDRTLVPMRAIFEAMDCDVEWNEDSQSVTVSKDFDDIMILWIDDTEMWTQDGYVTLDVPPQIVNDRTLVPVRAISEALNCDVDWDEDTRTVVITSNSNVYNIEDIVFENTNEDVLREIFGEPDKKGNKHMELYTGYFYQDWNYHKQGICFRMCSESENGEQYVDGCFISAPSNLKLKTGIGIGSTKKELLQKYSEPETYGKTLNIIFENENGISFGLENDYISSIHIGSLFE